MLKAKRLQPIQVENLGNMDVLVVTKLRANVEISRRPKLWVNNMLSRVQKIDIETSESSRVTPTTDAEADRCPMLLRKNVLPACAKPEANTSALGCVKL